MVNRREHSIVNTQLPEAFSSAFSLGSLEGFFPLRKANRWTPLVLALLFLSAAGGVFVYGALEAYVQWQQYGPAVISRYLTMPVIISLALFLPGVWASWAAYANRHKAAAVYQHGFAYNDWQGLKIWRWEEVLSLRAAITRHYYHGIYTGTTHAYTLERKGGGRLALNDALTKVEDLARHIQRKIFPILYERASQA